MFRRISFLTLFLLFTTVSSATYISIEANVYSTHLGGDNFLLNISLLNHGDEDAHNVHISLVHPEGFKSTPAIIDSLKPNIPQEAYLNLTIPSHIKKGTYPLILKIQYTDSNSYPFSVLFFSFFRYIQSTPQKIIAKMGEISISGNEEKNLTLWVSNLDEKPHNFTLKFHLPDELKAKFYSTEIYLKGRDITNISVPVSSLSALPFSTYIVLSTIEYEDGEFHYASTGVGKVKIVPEEEEHLTPFLIPLEPLILSAILVFSILIFLVYQLKLKK